ncbi:hypothetical protein M2408_001950 [Sphingobacterium sp. BIGb0165]|nr:hypothetical protein [Sphingobacterium sp. BIGb0165]
MVLHIFFTAFVYLIFRDFFIPNNSVSENNSDIKIIPLLSNEIKLLSKGIS